MYPWDYIKQWNSFLNTSLETLSCTEFAIYARLFQINNERGRNEYFQVKYSILAYFTGLSLKSISLGINALQQKGFIEVKKGKKNAPSEFKLVLLYESNMENKAKNFRLNGNEMVTNRKRNGNKMVTNRKRNGNKIFEDENTVPLNNGEGLEPSESQKNDEFPTKDFYIKDKEKVKGKEKDKYIPPNPPKGGEVDIFAEYAGGNSALLQTLREFEIMRKKIKAPMTEHAKKLLCANLSKLAEGTNAQIAVLEQSIFNGWKGLYPLRDVEVSGQLRGQRGQPKENPQVAIGKRAMEMLQAMKTKTAGDTNG